MKRDADKITKLRALVVELGVAAEDIVDYNNNNNNNEDGELYGLPTIVYSVRDIVREKLRKVEEVEE